MQKCSLKLLLGVLCLIGSLAMKRGRKDRWQEMYRSHNPGECYIMSILTGSDLNWVFSWIFQCLNVLRLVREMLFEWGKQVNNSPQHERLVSIKYEPSASDIIKNEYTDCSDSPSGNRTLNGVSLKQTVFVIRRWPLSEVFQYFRFWLGW